MAEETKPSEGNGAPTPEETPSVDPVAAARELLIAEGHQVLDSTAFHGIKTKAAAAAEAKASELQAKYDSLQAESAKLAEYKATIENKDKGESELYAERQRAWEASDREKDTEVKRAEKEREIVAKLLAKERVENRLRGLITGVTPGGEEAALDWAQKHVGKRLSTDDSGQLVWTTDTGVPHVGPAAAKLVDEWWQSDSQKFLHGGNAPGPATQGAASAAPPATGFTPDPSKSEMENYLAAEAHDKAARRA